MSTRSAGAQLASADDPHLEVTVTPSASAFYAGEVFSAVISFRNTRVPYHTPATPTQAPTPPHASSASISYSHSYSVPGTPNLGSAGASSPGAGPSAWLTGSTSYSPTSPVPSATSPGHPWTPATAGWRGEHARRPSGQGHTRRSQSLALGKGTLSPQEMVWALGADTPRESGQVHERD
jgi:hypothetical protein